MASWFEKFLLLSALFSGPSSGDAKMISGNPYEWKGGLYVNPSYQAELQTSIDTLEEGSAMRLNLEAMAATSSAFWVDKKAKIAGNDTSTVEGILADAASRKTPPLVTFIVYDLPNRDCNAAASNGELCCTYNDDGTCDYTAGGDCSEGIAEYANEYVAPFASALAKYDGVVPVVLVIEPDSLPNLATNLDDPHCGDTGTQASYRGGISAAVGTLAAACPSSCTLYADAAHGGWLGWPANLEAFAALVTSLDIVDKLRGFVTNSANYQPLGTPCAATGDTCSSYRAIAPEAAAVVPRSSRVEVAAKGGAEEQQQEEQQQEEGDDAPACCADPCGLLAQGNPANNEYNYVTQLWAAFASNSSSGGDSSSSFDPRFLIDTGRNGVDDMRSSCSNWCNVRGAGVGALPTTDTALGADGVVDALYWLKTPGESDGCTQELPKSDDDPYAPGLDCPRFDSMCASVDSIGTQSGEPYCPEAGKWFDYQIKQLGENAVWGQQGQQQQEK